MDTDPARAPEATRMLTARMDRAPCLYVRGIPAWAADPWNQVALSSLYIRARLEYWHTPCYSWYLVDVGSSITGHHKNLQDPSG